MGFPVTELLDNISLLIYLYIMNGKQIIKRLQKEGWKLDRVNGSHHMMIKDGELVPVPVHGSTDIPIGTLLSIQKSTGVKLK